MHFCGISSDAWLLQFSLAQIYDSRCVSVCLCVWVSVCLCSYGNVRVYGYVYVFLGALWVTSSSNLHLLWQMNWVATKKWQMTWQNGKLAAATEAQAAKPQ